MVDFVECTTGARVPAGVVSEGTLRPQDILISSMRVFEIVNPGASLVMTMERQQILGVFVVQMCDAQECGEFALAGHEWDEIIDLINEIHDAINAVLPEGWMFGSHVGDPACIGIWEGVDE